MHQFMRARPLGGQQLLRLRELRQAGDSEVQERHLRREERVSASLRGGQRSVESPVSRTVDAIVQERLQGRDGISTSARLRDKVAAARRGVQTERSERDETKEGTLRAAERTKTTRKIVAVRRRGGATSAGEETGHSRRRMGKEETEWIERQLQYSARAATLERECNSAWQSFFAGAGASSSSSAGFVSTAEVNKMVEEMELTRRQEVQKIRHQLRKVSSKANDVQRKVEEIENGHQFLSELQERIDMMETALAKCWAVQRNQFEEYALEEKVLEKELAVFMEKMSGWGDETHPLTRGGASSASLGPRLAYLNSKSGLNAQRDTISRMRRSSNNDEQNDGHIESNQREDRSVRTGTPDELSMANRVGRHNDAILRSGGLKDTSHNSPPGTTSVTHAKSRAKIDRLLEQWKQEKKQREEVLEQRRRELQKKREAIEARRKQEQLDAKQKILLYKLQKEQEEIMLDRTAKQQQDGAAGDGLQTGPLYFSPTSKEDLVERSRIAIEYAKAKRLRLQQIEERKQKQLQLPPRPEVKTADDNVNSSTKQVLVFNATEASKARDLSKDELRRKARHRERQGAHDAYIPGEKAIPDVKFKSFGHVAIQPRAVPAWRKNI